ncbi:MAG: hypothetical protein HY646_17705 [Acidobacteria bacterium]|nr:hypothetical protein [Acidobacteriota bacterium]
MSKPSLIEQLDRGIDEIVAGRGVAPSVEEPQLAALLELASALCDLPDREFRKRLGSRLEREAVIMKTGVDPIPAGFHTITPYIVTADAVRMIEFVKNAFGAVETFRTEGPGGRIHAEVRIGECMMMIGGGGQPKPAAIHLFVDNVDEVFQRAVSAGATSLMEPKDLPYGERTGAVEDASGTEWYIASPIGPDPRPEGFRTFAICLHPTGAAKLIDFLERAFDAAVVLRHDSPEGVVLHAKVRIGDTIVEMGEAHGQWQDKPSMIYMYVPNVDAAYKRAIDAGGKSIAAPADHDYGDRSGGIEDPVGNQWYIATHIGG